ncbi:MAG: DNA polymerase III subunit delta' [Alphaproteobacteria bacterium]|nr:DNA polymerase III subunit delta' [Alphaproteobacteria bacterium]
MAELPVIVGHDVLLAQLREAVDGDRLHHALLFEGPSGVGRHTTARWLALVANCEDDPGQRPCGRCRACTMILAGQHPDVIEVGPDPDLATPTIPASAVRELVRLAGFHRFSARRRFVILDPADALQPAGANALLKTLEEPPAGTHFVLVVGQARSLLPTIVSRCQRTRFAPVEEASLRAWLEARGVPEAEALARAAQGSPGTALALADGALEARDDLATGLLAALAGDLQGIFTWSEGLTKGSRRDWAPRAHAALDLLEELLRDVVVQAAGADQPLLHPALQPRTEAWVGALWPSGVSRCSDALTEARRELALNVSGKNVLDAVITRFATELGAARKGGRAA